ncbi:MAG: DegV family protein [Oscillospiraceae bacterium]|nr:DegV family protein [Oscillospiraceae bacterium]
MRWNIVTDSSCDLFPEEYENGEVGLSSVPFVISVGDRDFKDDENLDVAEMVDAMEEYSGVSRSSCPSPDEWLKEFDKAEMNIALPISSNLSGSMNSAVVAQNMALENNPDKRVAVVDSHSTGPEVTMCVERIRDMIKSGMNFDNIVSEVQNFFKDTHIAFALSSFDNLVKNGRMNKIVGFIAKKLGMWGIGVGSDEGKIEIKGKVRGSVRMIGMLIDEMKEKGFNGGRVIISHCQNSKLAEVLRDKIISTWNSADVLIMPTRGLCSFYAEREGLILSF